MHEPSELILVRRWNKKQGSKTGGRKWNVWYEHLRCPVCGWEESRLSNVIRGRVVRCVGTGKLKITAKE